MKRHLLTAALVVVAALVGGVGAASAATATPTADADATHADAADTAPAAATGDRDAAANATTTCDYPYTTTDATGATVTVNDTPQRVVVVGPSATQTVWEVGAADRVVGIWRAPSTTYLDNASAKANVAGSYGYADAEAVLNQSPDLVLLADIQKNDTAETLRDAGVTVYKFDAASDVADIYAQTNTTGRLVGSCAGAAETVSWMHERLDAVRDVRERANETPTVYYPMGGGYTVGPGSFITDAMRQAGARNVVLDANVTEAYPKVGEEFVVQHPPDWLLASYDPALTNGTPDPRAALPESQAVNHTRAYRDGRVVLVNSNYLSQPAPRVVYPIENITKALHPDAWAAVHAERDANATVGNEATTTDGSQTTGDAADTTETTTTGSSPGLGLVAAVAALAAVGLRRRRD